MTDEDLDVEFLVGPPEVLIPRAVQATAENMMDDEVIVASFVLAAFRDSKGRVRIAKAAIVESLDGMKRLGRALGRLADEIESGEVETVLVTRRQNSPGGDT
jgi:hypothetical protein